MIRFEVDYNVSVATTQSPSSSSTANAATISFENKLLGYIKRLAIAVIVVSIVLAIALVFLIWWFCIRKSHTGVPYTGAIPGP